MFELQFKGFKPLNNVVIQSEDGVFSISNSTGAGTDCFVQLLFYLERMLTGMKTDQLWYMFHSWKPEEIKTLDINIKKDADQYHLVLTKKNETFVVKAEELTLNSKVVLARKGRKYDGYTAPENELRWRVSQYNNGECWLHKLQAQDMDSFMWYPVFMAADAQRNSLKKKLLYSGKDYIAEINKRIRLLTDEYSYIEQFIDSVTGDRYFKALECATEEKTWRMSGKFINLLEMLYRLINGANVIWYPETVIARNKHDDFCKVISAFAKENPIFIITEEPLFESEKSHLNFKTDKNGITCECHHK